MFDFLSARDHMVNSQIRTSDVTDHAVLKAFRSVSRENFVPKSKHALAYGDSHIDLGEGRVMIKPRDFSKMVQAADIESTDVVLDIACGRGYSSAILAHLCETVVSLETTDAAVEKASEKLIAADISNVAVVKGDLKLGASEHGPFDVIFVNGAVSSLPKTWTDQLANNGRLVCIVQKGPVGHASIFRRSGDVIGEHIIFDTSLAILPGFERQAEFVL